MPARVDVSSLATTQVLPRTELGNGWEIDGGPQVPVAIEPTDPQGDDCVGIGPPPPHAAALEPPVEHECDGPLDQPAPDWIARLLPRLLVADPGPLPVAIADRLL
jgi:hypothetical protein